MRNFIIGLLIGGGLGSGITYYICKTKFEKKLEEERAKAREYYKNYYEQKQIEEDDAKAKHVNVVPDKPIPNEYEKLANEYKAEDRETDPAELERPTEEELIEQSENIDKMHNALEESHEKVKLLKVEHFGEINTYDTESLTYYVYDQTLIHEDESIVDDEAYLLGDALDRYGWRDDDEDESPLYCRNYHLQKDFEVVKVFAEYEPQ